MSDYNYACSLKVYICYFQDRHVLLDNVSISSTVLVYTALKISGARVEITLFARNVLQGKWWQQEKGERKVIALGVSSILLL